MHRTSTRVEIKQSGVSSLSKSTAMAVQRSGSARWSLIGEVTLRRARLVLGWVTVRACNQHNSAFHPYGIGKSGVTYVNCGHGDTAGHERGVVYRARHNTAISCRRLSEGPLTNWVPLRHLQARQRLVTTIRFDFSSIPIHSTSYDGTTVRLPVCACCRAAP